MISHLNIDTFDYLLEGFQVIDFDWRYVYVNKSAIRQSKFQKQELIGFTMMEKYPGFEKTDLFKTLHLCMTERISRQIENEFIYPDHSKGWFELHVQPVPEGLFILSIDISRRKKIELEILKMNHALEEMVNIRTQELETKNKNIMDSFRYAQNIQNAFIQNKSGFFDLLPNSFILCKPKDIISGDFYWYKETNDHILFAASDCTGHGVPGALMSMIGIEKLNSAVLMHKEPADILHQLNIDIKTALSYPVSEINDGMDIAICTIDKKNKVLKFSGANRPLWYISKGQTMLQEVKGTKHSIGGFADANQYYINHSISFEEGDTFYIFSDGYADTFGGHADKKLMTRKFKEILVGIQNQSLIDQGKYLDAFIDKWTARSEQVDDILVIGVRL
ncbi:MAG: SpoIIE family protein phosphatase [Bacteroidota bacterium]